ncbi:MAG: NB-ARC domain-containing protein [Cyanobacteria bacterium P01_E01_bin.6]
MGNTIGRLSPNVPKLPPHFLPREEDLTGIKAKVLGKNNQFVAVTTTRNAASIHGMGGIGKSVLASAVARDEEVRQAFPDYPYPDLLKTTWKHDLAKFTKE